MKNSIIFIIFIIYTTFIFFLNNVISLLAILMVNFFIMIILRINMFDSLKYLLRVSPFIILTVIINLIFSSWQYSILVGSKLFLVCNITYIYSRTTTVRNIASTIKNLCAPLQLMKINTYDIEVMVCISLSMIPILKREYSQIKDACIAKSMKINVKNMKVILTKLIESILKRVNEIEESLIEKGYGDEI